MARDLLVSVRIGAALSGTFRAAFDSARGTSLRLGQTADDLRNRHVRLGEAMARAMAHPGRNVGELRRQYDQLGQTIDRLQMRQERLAASMARGQALASQRSELRGSAMETAGTALALGAPVVQSVRLAASYQDQIKDIAITGEFSRAEEASLGATLRESALKWNQTQAEVARGINVLVAGGIQDAKALEAYAPVMTKAATAGRSSMDNLGNVAIALKDNLGIGVKDYENSLNMLTYAGKRGQFEVKDMSKWLPNLTPAFQAMGVTGKEAVAEIGAALQIARKGAGSNDEAANNFKNFLQKITAPDTLKDFEKAGIDLKQSMLRLRAEGMTPVQAMLSVITKYMTSKGPEAAGKFQAAMALKDDKERQLALQKLSESYKLGDLFQDMQAMSFIRPAIANMGEMQDIKRGSMAAGDQGLLDKDFERRMEGATSQFDRFKIGLADIGITIGDALLPSLTELMTELRPGVQAFGAWAKEHPGAIKNIVGLVGGLLGAKIAFIGLKYGINLVLSPINDVRKGFQLVTGKWEILRAMWQAGRFAPVIVGLRSVGGGLLGAGRFLMVFGQGFLMAFGAPFALAGRGIWGLSKLLAGGLVSGLRLGGVALMSMGRGALLLGRLVAGNLVTGLRLAGQAVFWLGRALMLNPIGLAITAIAAGAYLIYRNWGTLKPWFLGLWGGIKEAFGSGIGGVLKLLVNWSPIGLLYKAFASAMKWLGVELPKDFTGFGGMLIDGLVNGISAKLGAAKESIVGFGGSIKTWFADTLGIRSPSRVFMGFGDNIAQGAALGIDRTTALAGKAVAGMALATTAAWGKPVLPALEYPALPLSESRILSGLQPAPLPSSLTPGAVSTVHNIRQRLDPVRIPELPPLQQTVLPVLPFAGAMPSMPNLAPSIRPQLHALQTPVLPPLSQTVHQVLQPAGKTPLAALQQPVLPVPTVMDGVQHVRQQFQPMQPQVLPPVSQTVQRTFSTASPELPQAALAQRLMDARAEAPPATAPAAASGNLSIQFSPHITVQGGDAAIVQQQVDQAMKLSFTEFEQLMKKYEADRRRRSYGGN